MAFRATRIVALRASRQLLREPGDPIHPNADDPTNKFRNHIYRDASGFPWFALDSWFCYRKPVEPEHKGRMQKISQSERLVKLTFVDMHGDAHHMKAEPGDNLAVCALAAGCSIEWMPNGGNTSASPWSHMIISNPHFDMLTPPCHREDKYLHQLARTGTGHRHSRVIKFIPVRAEMDGMVVTHPFFADVVTPNFTDPFTGKVEDKDAAAAPTHHVIGKVVDEDRPDYKFPSVWELLWNRIDTYPELWDYTRQSWLQRLEARKAARAARER
jgi:hypothetical protein|uniref:Uncharacterized protein n=1 Tax=Eutreptiella gymnastica TaxID=73025 RepID=A0A7S4LMT8_9EUGL